MRRLQLLGLAIVILLAQSAYAHHPFDSDFDRTKPVKLTGMIAKVEWGAPHVMLYLDVKDGARAGQWTVEMGGPQQLTAEGWTQTSLKPGAEVTIEGWLAKNGSMRANAKSVISGDRTLSAASSYYAEPAQLAAADTNREVLPGTASSLPLVALIGLLALMAGVVMARPAIGKKVRR